jgi:integrase
MTLDRAAGRYWNEVGQHHAGAKNTERELARLVDYFGRARPINTITGDDIAKLVAWRRGHHVAATGHLIAPGTVNIMVRLLRRVFTRAKEIWSVRLDREPIWRKHMLKEPSERVRELQEDERERLDAAMRDDYAPLFGFVSATGQRKTECFTLRWSDVNWETRQIKCKAAPRNRRIGSHRDVRRGFPTRGALHIVGS